VGGVEHDICVIGGGVVGLAAFRRFSMAGLKVVLVERAADILAGASKGNSAILHTGFDAPPGSLEVACMQAGYAEYLEIAPRLNLPVLETGAHVVAWTEAELAALPGIVEKAHANGVVDVREIDAATLRAREPHLAEGALGAVEVPREHVIDPWAAPLAYAHQGLAMGGTIVRGCDVQGGDRRDGVWTLATSRGPVRARTVINAAGNLGDLVEAIARPSPFRVRPRKGQFVVFDKPASRLARSIILPVPSERTKGVLACRTIWGNLLVGPTAEDQEERAIADLDRDTLAALVAAGRRLIPALADETVTATYAGLRPATEFKDYQVSASAELGWITLGGIRSTGLTAALGIAAHAARLYGETIGPLPGAAPEPVWTPVPNLAEHLPRPYQDGGHIVCHCEWVTRAELEAALGGAFPAGNLGGLKRRTRAMMGRCQGFYCGAEIARIADGRLADVPGPRA
jgi:glycerol-3-phosphate dehydrogenase